MFKTSVKKAATLKRAALIVSIAALPVLWGVTGCSTGTQYKQSTGEYIDDHTISSQVKKALGQDPQFKYDQVNVTTFKGTVQLSGFVNTREQKSRAGELAKKVDAVKEVQNNITVKE